MFNYLSRKYKDIITLLLIFLVLISITTTHRLENKLRWYDKAVLFVSTPMQYALDGLIGGIVNFSNKYILLFNINKDNSFLLNQNRLLKKELNELKEFSYENKRLKQLLLFKEEVPYFMLPAQVFARDASLEYKTIRINKGESSGIKIGMAVVNYEGIVGQIIRLSNDYSDVLIITDPNSAVDALVQRSRVRGIVQGKGEDYIEIKYLDRLDDVEIADVVVTSGFAGKFPKGIVIGQVKKIERKEYGVTQVIKLDPSVNFNKLEEVFVIFEGK